MIAGQAFVVKEELTYFVYFSMYPLVRVWTFFQCPRAAAGLSGKALREQEPYPAADSVIKIPKIEAGFVFELFYPVNKCIPVNIKLTGGLSDIKTLVKQRIYSIHGLRRDGRKIKAVELLFKIPAAILSGDP